MRSIPACRRLAILTSCVLGAACAQGGDEDRPTSEVKIEANHHMFGLGGRHQFSEFPIPLDQVGTDRGTLIMREDSSYRIQRAAGTSGAETYALEKSGLLSILIDQGARRSKIRFLGAYGLEGATNRYYFTDRHLASETSRVGMFFGVRVVPGTANLEGDWHLFSLHAIFSKSQVLNPANVGRAASGTVAVDAAGKITGSGLESTRATLQFTGDVRAFDDGRVDLTVVFKDAQVTDERLFSSAAGPGIVVGIDEIEQKEIDDKGGEAGMIVWLRKRTGTADKSLLAGSFHLGAHTIFVNPTNSGFDAANGTLSFTAAGAFRIEAVGTNGVEFKYTGTYTLADDGALVLTVDGTKETWAGAVDQEYKTVLLCDNFVEERTGNKPPELNLFVGIRPVPAN
jgi:hypothetical protein